MGSRLPSPRMRATTSLVLSYRIEQGTPPKNSKLTLCPAPRLYGGLRELQEDAAAVRRNEPHRRTTGSVRGHRSSPERRRDGHLHQRIRRQHLVGRRTRCAFHTGAPEGAGHYCRYVQEGFERAYRECDPNIEEIRYETSLMNGDPECKHVIRFEAG